MDITIQNLSYIYHRGTPFERSVFHGINLQLASGNMIAIIGKTGSGKSTFVQHLNGLLTPTEGSLTIGKHRIEANRKKNPSLVQDVGMVFQYPEHQLFEETVAKDIAFGPRNLGWPDSLIEARLKEIVALLEIDPALLSRSPFSLSGGQKRRVALAGVLVMQPKLLILDEPTAGLDPLGKGKLMNILHQWQREAERTVLFITHHMDDVAEFADEVIVLEDGRIRWHTTPYSLFTTHALEIKQMGLMLPTALQWMEELNQGLDEPIPITSIRSEDIIASLAGYFSKRKG